MAKVKLRVAIPFLLSTVVVASAIAYLITPGLSDRYVRPEALKAAVHQRLWPPTKVDSSPMSISLLVELLPPAIPTDVISDNAALKAKSPSIARQWIAAAKKMVAVDPKRIQFTHLYDPILDQFFSHFSVALSVSPFLVELQEHDLNAELFRSLKEVVAKLRPLALGTNAEGYIHNFRGELRRRMLQLVTDQRFPQSAIDKIGWQELSESEMIEETDWGMRTKFWQQLRTFTSRASERKRPFGQYDEVETARQLSKLYIDCMDNGPAPDVQGDYPAFSSLIKELERDGIRGVNAQFRGTVGFFEASRRKRIPNYFGKLFLSTITPFDGSIRKELANARIAKFLMEVRKIYNQSGRWPSFDTLRSAEKLVDDPFNHDPIQWNPQTRVAWSSGIVGAPSTLMPTNETITLGGGAGDIRRDGNSSAVPLISAPPGPPEVQGKQK